MFVIDLQRKTSIESATVSAYTPFMPLSSEEQQPFSAKALWALFLGSLSLVPISLIFGLFDTTTELLPRHDEIDQTLIAVAGLCGLVVCGMGIYLTRKLTIKQRIMLPLVLTFETAIGLFLVDGHVASIVEGWHDFPAQTSHTREALFPISRAYQTDGKGSSQYIQTAPIWTNLEITREDYAFMRTHRNPDDHGQNTDEISSRGYFCANGTVEQSDNALRILHSGSRKLPQGTVILCPASTGRD